MSERSSRLHSEKGLLPQDWCKVGSFLYLAMIEHAQEHKDDELADFFSELRDSDDMPSPASIELLKLFYPDDIGDVLTRAEQIQAEEHERELANTKKPKFTKIAELTLSTIKNIHL
ncbi:MAG: hypothetical protein WCP03_03735 [Candidatus Saccharibacteria bacterium]